MPRVTIDSALRDALRKFGVPVEVCDETGTVLGRYIPREALAPQISEEEIERRIREGGGRPLREILADLGKRA